MRFTIANILYRVRFPSGGIRATDFRPHFDGYVLNATTLIPTGAKPELVKAVLSRRLRQSFGWMRFLRFLLRQSDKVLYCLGTSEPRQQYMKAWSTRDDLAAGIPPRDVAKYWAVHNGVPAGR